MTKKETEYALSRVITKNGTTCWQVAINRRGKTIARNFFDSVYGSSRAAYNIAKAWRNEIMLLVPPKTNVETAIKPRKNNSSGVPGIFAIKRNNKIVAWQAKLESNGQVQQKKFTVSAYKNEMEAKQAAIQKREEWLAKLDINFRTLHTFSTQKAKETFPEFLNITSPPLALDDDEITIRVARINSRYDALRPKWITVHITQKKENLLSIYVSDSGFPAKIISTDISIRKYTLSKALDILRLKAIETLSNFYDQKIADNFNAQYGLLFTEKYFRKENEIYIKELLSS